MILICPLMLSTPIYFEIEKEIWMKIKLLTLLLLSSSLSFAADSIITNKDIIDMLNADLSDDIIVSVLQQSEVDFDNSPQALISLKQAGASDEVIAAALDIDSPSATAGGSNAAPRVAEGDYRPDVVTINFSGSSEEMRYVLPSIRTAARGFGFGGIATYMVLRGEESSLKINDNTPSFILSIPANAQPESYVELANFAVRRNGTREVMVGGGYMSYSSGITRDRSIPFTITELSDQSNAADGFIVYEVVPESALEQGQYAVIFYNSEIPVVGYFGAGNNSAFDFTVL